MNLNSVLIPLGFVVLSFAAAAPGAIFRPGAWYERLSKPSWRPPNWLFAPVWTILYLTIAVAGWLVWRNSGFEGAALPFAIYVVSLMFNAAWSGLFFGLRRPDLAFLDVSLLWLSIAGTIAAFAPIEQAAAWLLVPYLCWVTFAAVLNFAVWRMNMGTAENA